MSNEHVEVTDQDILKALEILGLGETDSNESNIEKGEGGDGSTKDPENNEDPIQKGASEDDLTKGGKNKEDEPEKEENEEEFKKAFDELKKSFPKSCDKLSPEIKKSEENTSFNIEDNDLIKGFSQKIDALTTLVKQQRATNDELKKSLDSTNFQLEEMGKQSQGRKSFTSKRQADYIEKSFTGEELSPNKQQLSLTHDKGTIDNLLLDLSGIEKGEINEFYKDAALLFNTSGVMDISTMNKLSREQNIQIVQ